MVQAPSAAAVGASQPPTAAADLHSGASSLVPAHFRRLSRPLPDETGEPSDCRPDLHCCGRGAGFVTLCLSLRELRLSDSAWQARAPSPRAPRLPWHETAPGIATAGVLSGGRADSGGRAAGTLVMCRHAAAAAEAAEAAEVASLSLTRRVTPELESRPPRLCSWRSPSLGGWPSHGTGAACISGSRTRFQEPAASLVRRVSLESVAHTWLRGLGGCESRRKLEAEGRRQQPRQDSGSAGAAKDSDAGGPPGRTL